MGLQLADQLCEVGRQRLAAHVIEQLIELVVEPRDPSLRALAPLARDGPDAARRRPLIIILRTCVFGRSVLCHDGQPPFLDRRPVDPVLNLPHRPSRRVIGTFTYRMRMRIFHLGDGNPTTR